LLSFNEQEKKFYISKLDIRSKSNKIESFFSYESSIESTDSIKTVLTQDTFFIYDTANKLYIFGELAKDEKSYVVKTGQVNQINEKEVCEVHSVNNIKYVFICGMEINKKNSAFVLKATDSSFEFIEAEKQKNISNILFDKDVKNKNSFLFFISKNNNKSEFDIETILFKEGDGMEKIGSRNIKLDDDDEIKLIRGKLIGKKGLNYVIVTNYHHIRSVEVFNNVK
jgi:hypothetical protein